MESHSATTTKWEVVPILFLRFSNISNEIMQYCISVEYEVESGKIVGVGSKTDFGWIEVPDNQIDAYKTQHPISRKPQKMKVPHKLLCSVFLQGDVVKTQSDSKEDCVKKNTYYLKLSGFPDRAFQIQIKNQKKITVKFVLYGENRLDGQSSNVYSVTPTLFEIQVSDEKEGTERTSGWIQSLAKYATIPSLDVTKCVLNGKFRVSAEKEVVIVEHLHITQEMKNNLSYKKMLKDAIFN